MQTREGIIVPALATCVLHAVLLAVLTFNWNPERDRVIKPMPRHVMARVVTMDKASVKKPTVAKPRVQPPKPRPEPPKPKPKVEPPKPKPTPQTQPKEKPKPDPKVEQERQREAERQRQQREMELALADDERTMQADAAANESMAYRDAIAEVIGDNWSRPPSARRGMVVVLRIQLVPSGDVVSVTVLKSSGNEAFDLSAINAVNKAGRFAEVVDMPPGMFEREFRSFQLVFNPEDLRL
jgi:TonB family protein